MAWRRLAQRCAPAAAPAALLGLGAARCEDTMQVPRTKKTPKELPEYFVPKVPYPAWDADWDGRRRARAEAKKRGAPPAPTRHILLVRHGQYDETSRDDDKRILTPLGRDQAVATGLRLRSLLDSGSPKSPIKMVSSGLVRAKETADLIAPCLPEDRLVYADPNPDLNEGRPAQVIPGRPYSNEAVRIDQKRVERAFRETFRRADPRDDGARHEYEIVVCHGNVIRYMTLRALQLPPEAWLRLCTFNCSLTYLVVRPTGSVSLRALGDVGHLDPPLVTFSMHHGIEW